MENILIYLKHKVPSIWALIEKINGSIFAKIYEDRLNIILNRFLPFEYKNGFHFRKLEENDINQLNMLLTLSSGLDFFRPHSFETSSLTKLYNNSSFLMMGVFAGNKLVGYFFLRFFINKKAFIGRMVSVEYQRRGLAKEMSRILYGIVWEMKFKCLTTISEENLAIFELHKKENNIIFLKKLSNNYHLVEILPN